MKIPYRPLVLGLTALVFATVLYERAQAGGGHFYPPIADPVVKEECGSCHLAFAPSMLPAKSWQVIMGDLVNHFGEDASVDAATAARIGAYLQANAADSGGRRYGAKLVSAVAPGSAPQRITKLPKWVAEHRSVPAWEWRHKDVRSPANCVACHADAERGYYES